MRYKRDTLDIALCPAPKSFRAGGARPPLRSRLTYVCLAIAPSPSRHARSDKAYRVGSRGSGSGGWRRSVLLTIRY